MPNLTIEDLRNPLRASGYDHVNANGATDSWRAASGAKPRTKGEVTALWRGPTRTSAAQAAQDYCDHVNGNFIQPSFKLKSAGHPTKPRKAAVRKDGKQRARPRKKEGPGYVYLMAEAEDPMWTIVKIGESESKPEYRLSGCQTGNGRPLTVIGWIYTDKRLELETKLHRKYLKRNRLQEWFWSSRAIFAEFGVKPPASYRQPTMKEVPTWVSLSK